MKPLARPRVAAHIASMIKPGLVQKREIINLIREFFTDRGYFEIETPLLVPSPAMEATLHGFETQYLDHQGTATRFFLPTSPEFAIKKALHHCNGPIFEIARVFRNRGELGPLHRPEFNMLEWYEAGDYTRSMASCEDLIHFLSQQFNGLAQRSTFSWDPPFPRKTTAELFQERVDLDLARGLSDPEYWRSACSTVLATPIPADESFDDLFFRVWLSFIEPRLGLDQPLIVTDYPASMAALARLKPEDERWAERWELYVDGLELGNAFGELTDSAEQARRFHTSNTERRALGLEEHPVDQELIAAVGQLSETTGVAIGVERLCMALTAAADIDTFFLQPWPQPEG